MDEFVRPLRVLLLKQWGALGMLALGVALVQISTSKTEEPEGESGDSQQDPVKGLIYVLMACCTSGFAGVYFEKVLYSALLRLAVLCFALLCCTMPYRWQNAAQRSH